LVGGSAPLYSTFVTSSDKAFALFLMNYYRNPPPAKETKIKKKHDDDNNNQDEGNQDEGNNDNSKKCIYKKKIDIRQGEKDYKKWMTTIQMMKKYGKQGVDNVDKRLTAIIGNYCKQLLQ